MGEVRCRGWADESSADSRVDSGSCHRREASPVGHHVSITVTTLVAGMYGRLRPGEHDGPEQGRSPREITESVSVGSARASSSNSRRRDGSRSCRSVSEVTSCPQPARAKVGTMHQTARSMKDAPAKPGLARPDDGFNMCGTERRWGSDRQFQIKNLACGRLIDKEVARRDRRV
jgi:hypothetical protein